MAGGPLKLWNAWATQILVLLSLTLQIVLLLFAGIRRRESSALLRFFLWLAYLLADSTAIYTLGHLSLSSVTRDHKLVAFWAPFLLLHLGRPDNITAYALQDNQLWLRHLQILVVQVLGAGYVVYKRLIVGGEKTILLLATVLMFMVGLVKYCERTFALKRGDFSSIRSYVKELPGKQLRWYRGYLQSEDHYNSNDEFLLQRAHSLFHICKRGIVDSVINVDMDKTEAEITRKLINQIRNPQQPMVMWKVMEMELSLLYDILYTKAAVIHTWIGYLIRAMTPVAIVSSFLLFHFSDSKDGQNVVDITVTYILLGGALMMEMTSLLSALGSSWALAFLCAIPWSSLRHAVLCAGRWHRLRRAVVTLRQVVMAMTGGFLGRSRKWSGTIGQFNMLYFRAAQIHATNRRFGTLAKKLGCEDWWDSTCYSHSIKIPNTVKERAVKMVSKRAINTLGLLRHRWGELALDKKKYPKLVGDLEEWEGVDFHESIIIWHIATDLILCGRNRSSNDSTKKKEVERVRSIRAMSNYLMFLLVTRPDMVPGLPQNWLYQRTCDNLDKICKENRVQLISSGGRAYNIVFMVLMKLIRGNNNNSTTSYGLEQTNELAKILLGMKVSGKFDPSVPRLTYAHGIAKTVLGWKGEDQIEGMQDPSEGYCIDLWTDFLIYAANRCNRESHAKKLNTGGEIKTVVCQKGEHIYQTKEN
ncbi:Os04g0153000 [Oryza sativa Japonica Group]|uniref:Os04g0153000 protein n=1 Tax=Oryza sativa subsp. japonica TaxID=39947 RepID=A0A0P0W732_ORYSJ|nr:Os04g0153000 [Oryza sativa Japonica Group]